MTVRLLLASESGEILDSTELLTVDEWNRARETMPGAYALLRELRPADTIPDPS